MSGDAGDAVAYVAIASSVEPERRIRGGLRRLNRVMPILASSPFYCSQAIGIDGMHRSLDPDFIHGLVRVSTRFAPIPLRRILHGIEAEEGRTYSEDRFAPRTLDLDLVAHGRRVLDGDLPRKRWLAVALLEMEPTFEIMPGRPLRDPGGPSMQPAPFGPEAILQVLRATI